MIQDDLDKEVKDSMNEWLKNPNNKISGNSFKLLLDKINKTFDQWRTITDEFEQQVINKQ